jgi:PAS domain S-box-containing protein
VEPASGRVAADSIKDLPTSRRRLAIYLLAAAHVLARATDVPEAALGLLGMIGDSEGFCAGAVWLATDGSDQLRCAQVWSPVERPAPEFERATREGAVKRGVGLAGRAWAAGRSLIVPDLARDDDARRDPRVERGGFRTAAAIPVATGADVIGVIELFGTAPREPEYLLGDMLASVAGQLAEFVRRAAAERALARAEERLRTVVGNAPIVLFGFDHEGRFTLGEGQGLAGAGLDARDLAGRSIFEVYRDAPAILEQARRALAGESFTATMELQRGPGSTGGAAGPRVYETRYSPIFDAGGKVVEVIGVATDVTDRANAERALRRSEAQLLEADRLASLGALAAGVAHEINNPLSYVLLNLDHVARELDARAGLPDDHAAPSFADLANRLREARSGLERVRLIVQDLKSFSRVGTERRVAVDVRRVLDSTIDIAANEIRHRARLVRDYGVVPSVEADPTRLGQVFLNLLVNAVQAMDESGVERNEIRVSAVAAPDGRVVVTIADTGAGIPPELRERIFEPFFTTKPAGVGTGLGLSICRNIVAALGGEIAVTSEVGRGTSFRVTLPAAASVRAAATMPTPPTPSAVPRSGTRASGAPGRSRGRVLIVDDEPVLASALGRSIEDDYQVVVLDSGREALDLLRRDDGFDVILCDLIMPVVTGMDLYEEIARTRPELAERIVFMSGGTFTPRARQFLASVKNPALEKPFELAVLGALLHARAAMRPG